MAQRVVHWAVGHGLEQREWQRRSDDNVLAFLHASLPKIDGLTDVVDPAAFVEFLRACLGRSTFPIDEVKRIAGGPEAARLRFTTTVAKLREDALPVPFGSTVSIARVADSYRRRTEVVDAGRWVGDVSLHFSLSSSLARKGRFLWNVVRLCRCSRALELGTAYGMSAMFLMDGMQAWSDTARLTTIEARNPQFSLASTLLRERFGDTVACIQANIDDALPAIAREAAPLDLFFHDAFHSGDAYARDFGVVVDHLQPGAIVIVDDIRWEDARFIDGPADTHAGWQKVVAHPRIVQAVEVSQSIGLALVGD